MSEEPPSPYDSRSYQRLADAAYQDGKLRVRFENGDAFALDPAVFERDLGPVDWAKLRWNEYELVVVVATIGETSIPWIDLRREQDPAFAAYLAAAAAEHALLAGARLQFLRGQKGLSVAGLAELSGIDPERLDLIERGRPASLPELQALAGPLEASLIDLLAVGG